MSHALCLLIAVALSACGALRVGPLGALAAVEVASVTVLGRDVIDVGVSVLSGKDCSIVRLDRGESYCKPEDERPRRPPVCTRSLGIIDCWSNPEALPAPIREVADGPRDLTPAQERDRAKGWLGW